MSSFPKIYDCPDIVEELSSIWTEDIMPLLSKQGNDIDYIVTKTKETISRLYLILFSDAFKSLEGHPTQSSAGNMVLQMERRDLI